MLTVTYIHLYVYSIYKYLWRIKEERESFYLRKKKEKKSVCELLHSFFYSFSFLLLSLIITMTFTKERLQTEKITLPTYSIVAGPCAIGKGKSDKTRHSLNESLNLEYIHAECSHAYWLGFETVKWRYVYIYRTSLVRCGRTLNSDTVKV